MRTSTLQYLYLQKPITMTVLICIISVIPWIALGDFSTKGEPREAAVAISMLETGDWILPLIYADEFAYKPPLAHWLMALFSYPQGYVSEFTSRLPSALAFIALIASTLLFFGRRLRFQEAFISVLLLLTCIEMHRAGMTTRVDMLLTSFIVIALFQLYRWEDNMQLKGLPVIVSILLSGAILTKGPVGIILPLFVFGVYLLLLNKYSILTIIKSLLYIGVASLFIPIIWYIAAWRQGGDDFLNLVLAENFGRFFHLSNINISYELGHENNVFYNFQTLLAGFAPWTLFFFFSLFGLKIVKPNLSIIDFLKNTWNRIRSMEKVQLFSLVALVCVIFFYSIPSSKRSVYLMPAYPFIALFLAQYALYLTEYRRKVTRWFAFFLVLTVSLALIVITLTFFKAINPINIAGRFTDSIRTMESVQFVSDMFVKMSPITAFILLFNLFVVGTVIYQLSKKINIKILYSTIALVFAVNLMIDGIVMPGLRNGTSSRMFAEQIKKEYPLNEDNVYVMNNLKEGYANLYGLNFYMGNTFNNFALELPAEGYFLSTEKSFKKVEQVYSDSYSFNKLTSTPNVIADVRDRIILFSFSKK